MSLLPRLALLVACLLIGCSGAPTAPRDGIPSDHTVSKGGVFHKPGLTTPFAAASGCSASDCHKSDLRGGQVMFEGTTRISPSCYGCHGVTWNQGAAPVIEARQMAAHAAAQDVKLRLR